MVGHISSDQTIPKRRCRIPKWSFATGVHWRTLGQTVCWRSVPTQIVFHPEPSSALKHHPVREKDQQMAGRRRQLWAQFIPGTEKSTIGGPSVKHGILISFPFLWFSMVLASVGWVDRQDSTARALVYIRRLTFFFFFFFVPSFSHCRPVWENHRPGLWIQVHGNSLLLEVGGLSVSCWPYVLLLLCSTRLLGSERGLCLLQCAFLVAVSAAV